MTNAPRRSFIRFACINRHKGCVTRHTAQGVEWMKAEVSGMVPREDGGFLCKECYKDMVEVSSAAKSAASESRP